jgi:hypothetical protein
MISPKNGDYVLHENRLGSSPVTPRLLLGGTNASICDEKEEPE